MCMAGVKFFYSTETRPGGRSVASTAPASNDGNRVPASRQGQGQVIAGNTVLRHVINLMYMCNNVFGSSFTCDLSLISLNY